MSVCGNPPDMHACALQGDKGMPQGVQPSCLRTAQGLASSGSQPGACYVPDAGRARPGCARPGNKSEAKALMSAAGVPVVPGYHGQDQSPPRSGVAAGWLCMQRASRVRGRGRACSACVLCRERDCVCSLGPYRPHEIWCAVLHNQAVS